MNHYTVKLFIKSLGFHFIVIIIIIILLMHQYWLQSLVDS